MSLSSKDGGVMGESWMNLHENTMNDNKTITAINTAKTTIITTTPPKALKAKMNDLIPSVDILRKHNSSFNIQTPYNFTTLQ